MGCPEFGLITWVAEILFECRRDIPDILKSAYTRSGASNDNNSYLDEYEDDFEDEDEYEDDLWETRVSVEEMWETFRANPTVRRFHGEDCAGIFKRSIGARNRVGIGLSYRPARIHKL